jgi:sucrose-6-phosphate hydrolase SacC (GH32 family)
MIRRVLFLSGALAILLPFTRTNVRGQAATDAKFPPELTRFVPYSKNPVFAAGGKGAWDERIRERGWIMRDGGIYKMWYTGYTGKPGEILKLGYATSPDGIAWTRFPGNPIYDEHWVEDMMVVKRDGQYCMFAEGKDDRAQLLVSDDGIKWTRQGQLDVRKKNGQPIADGPYGTPTAWLEDGTWHLFYERSDLGIWLATSKDLKTFTNVLDEPVMLPGPAEYEKDLIALNQIIKHKGRYYAYYHGSARSGPAKGLWSTCIATSTDLKHWEKFAGNPLQPMKQNKSSGIVVHDGQRFCLYTMHPVVDLHLPAR